MEIEMKRLQGEVVGSACWGQQGLVPVPLVLMYEEQRLGWLKGVEGESC